MLDMVLVIMIAIISTAVVIMSGVNFYRHALDRGDHTTVKPYIGNWDRTSSPGFTSPLRFETTPHHLLSIESIQL